LTELFAIVAEGQPEQEIPPPAVPAIFPATTLLRMVGEPAAQPIPPPLVLTELLPPSKTLPVIVLFEIVGVEYEE
jgi:hypothetical protein